MLSHNNSYLDCVSIIDTWAFSPEEKGSEPKNICNFFEGWGTKRCEATISIDLK
jgi:hypothetical protein